MMSPLFGLNHFSRYEPPAQANIGKSRKITFQIIIYQQVILYFFILFLPQNDSNFYVYIFYF